MHWHIWVILIIIKKLTIIHTYQTSSDLFRKWSIMHLSHNIYIYWSKSCRTGILRVSQGYYKIHSRVFREFFKGVSMVFQDCFKGMNIFYYVLAILEWKFKVEIEIKNLILKWNKAILNWNGLLKYEIDTHYLKLIFKIWI